MITVISSRLLGITFHLLVYFTFCHLQFDMFSWRNCIVESWSYLDLTLWWVSLGHLTFNLAHLCLGPNCRCQMTSGILFYQTDSAYLPVSVVVYVHISFPYPFLYYDLSPLQASTVVLVSRCKNMWIINTNLMWPHLVTSKFSTWLHNLWKKGPNRKRRYSLVVSAKILTKPPFMKVSRLLVCS